MRIWFAAAALLWASPALAHAMLDHATPAAGAVLKTTPKEVVLQFSEPLEPTFSTLQVQNAGGASVAEAPAITDRTIRAPLKALAPGTYRVVWHAVSIDTHRTEGAFTFMIKP